MSDANHAPDSPKRAAPATRRHAVPPKLAAVLAALVAGFLIPPMADAVLEPDVFDHAFGPDGCGDWTECGNELFGTYQTVRGLALVSLIVYFVMMVISPTRLSPRVA